MNKITENERKLLFRISYHDTFYIFIKQIFVKKKEE